MPLTHYVGPCYVMEVPEKTLISGDFMREHLPKGVTRLLIKGRRGEFPFQTRPRTISKTAALSPSARTAGASLRLTTNRASTAFFLGNGIAIIEQMALSEVPEGTYTLCAAPVKLRARTARPAALCFCGIADVNLKRHSHRQNAAARGATCFPSTNRQFQSSRSVAPFKTASCSVSPV